MDDRLKAASAFLDWHPIAHAGLTAAPREGFAMASFSAVRGKTDALADVIRSRYELELPRRPIRVEGKGIAVAWAGPDQWLAIAERSNTSSFDLEAELKATLTGLASVVDQSDGRVIVRIAGPRARDVLAKGVPIDLHPRAFKPGDVAITHASHIGVILWQIDDRPTYDLAMFRSYADSFAHWLSESDAEYAAAAS